MFVVILGLIRYAHRQTEYVDTQLGSSAPAIEFVSLAFGEDASIGEFNRQLGGNLVNDESGKRIGCLLQTSPDGDQHIGYSGPTNCLIALDLQGKIICLMILNSGDTLEHVAIVRESQSFLQSFQGLGFESSDQWKKLDAVSGATLTSYAIVASVAERMNGSVPSLKFRAQPGIENVARLFTGAASLQPTDQRSVWNVFDKTGNRVGAVLSTSPAADHLSGYQGPTATLAGFDLEGKCIGLVVDQSYDNQPYATYLDDDYGFLDFYSGKSLEELAQMDPQTIGIEGVSGATMTSMCVATALPIAAKAALSRERPTPSSVSTRKLSSYWMDWITMGLTLIGVALSISKLRRRKWFRLTFQGCVILFLGFTSGHMLSQAQIAGWSTHSIPWSVAPGLVFLSGAALLVPLFSKHQPYCHHLCPFGAMQQLARNRVGYKLHLPISVRRVLDWIPFTLLLLVVLVSISGSNFNLAGIEPFDAFELRVAGWATISIFVVGLLISLVVPMAYCRFGCPTGALLNFLRFRADSHRLGLRDVGALGLVLLAIISLF